MKKSSRNWTPQEDKMLEEIYNCSKQTKKLKWQQIAQVMHKRIYNCQKTGKQCRERWHNHLAPELNNSSEWTKQQNDTLFKKHSQIGNKWAKIATCLKGRTDNCVKNHFYSTLRRGMRKVNNYIHEQRKQKNSIKQFKQEVLSKILIIADGDPQQKLNAKNNAGALAKNIKQFLIKISLETDEDTYDAPIIDQAISLIMQFNKNCKKRKGKKKGGPIDKNNNEEKDSQKQQEIDQISQQQSSSHHKNIQSNIKMVDKTSKQIFGEKQISSKRQVKRQQDFKQNIFKSQQIATLQKTNNHNYQKKQQTKQIFQNQAQNVKTQWNQFYKRSKVRKSMSLQSQGGQFVNIPNFDVPIGNSLFTNTEPTKGLFRNSQIDIPFSPPPQLVSSNKIFGASQIGIKQCNNPLANLSQFSDNSFFKLVQGDKGVINTEVFHNNELKKSQFLNKMGNFPIT